MMPMVSKIERVPIVTELNTHLSPVALFELFRCEPHCFFLDSSMDPHKLGRYSLMGSRPFLIFKTHNNITTVTRQEHIISLKGNPLDILGEYLDTYRLGTLNSPVPCTGGAVGYFAYDIGRYIERLPSLAINDLDLPELYFGFYDLMLIYDNLLGKTFLVSTGFPAETEKGRMKKAAERTAQFQSRLGANNQ